MIGDYREFLARKKPPVLMAGFEVDDGELNPILKPHQRAIAAWMIRGGRRACFAAFGLGKTVIQLEAVRVTRERLGGMGLIIAPLGVRQEFASDAAMLGAPLRFIRRTEEAVEEGLYLTNYESVRDGRLDPTLFSVVSLDEASCLRGFGGTKTFRQFMATIAGDDRAAGTKTAGVRCRFVASATPSPNSYEEILAYSCFLDVMDVGQAKTRFFQRNSEQADKLTLRPAKEEEFWHWVGSWACFVQKPSDLGFSDEGYELPELDLHFHRLPSDHTGAGADRVAPGVSQLRLLKVSDRVGVVNAANEKRSSLPARIAKMVELRAIDPAAHRLIWHDLEAEREAVQKATGCAAVYGKQDEEEQAEAIRRFSWGEIQELAVKPVMSGQGCNFQRFCSWAIYLGIGFKFNDFIQSIHRLQRFLQPGRVRVDIIYTEAEDGVLKTLMAKWENHKKMVGKMAELIKLHGLSHAEMGDHLKRAMGVERVEFHGAGWRVVNEDAIIEWARLDESSVDLIVSSLPFANQYEYSPNFADLGHTDDNAHFWEQMGYLTLNLLRALKPGRVAAIHCKDRITPGGINGFGFQTVTPFSDQCVAHFTARGFAFLARITVVTDVVRENNATYRLGHSEKCKDGTRQGKGLPEYVLIFRKAPTDRTNGYADEPVAKTKGEYPRGRWQNEASGFWRSSGNRILQPEDLEGRTQAEIFRLFRSWTYSTVYDHEQAVKIAESLDLRGLLPSTFQLLQTQSWHPEVWSDVMRARTLNVAQGVKGKAHHLCPLQLDIVDRLILGHSNPGELVADPFGGIGTVPARAVALGRCGFATELSPVYAQDAAFHCGAAEKRLASPTLFDIDDEEDSPE